MTLNILVAAATGGLGKALVREALNKGHSVSVLVRDKAKLAAEFSSDELARLAHVTEGDAHDPAVVGGAVANIDVVLSGKGADAVFARVIAEQAKAAGVKKFVFVAGATNVMSDDGVTPAWKEVVKWWPPAESAYNAHQPCIDAIRATGINSVVFCPGMMRNVGAVSVPPPAIKINRQSGGFVSYEDAAWVMLHAAEVADYDNQLITAATATAK